MRSYHLVDIDGSAAEVWSNRPNSEDGFTTLIDSCEAVDKRAARGIFYRRYAKGEYEMEGVYIPDSWNDGIIAV